MAKTANTGRANQRRRARGDLLRATARLLRQGRRPSLEEVAEEALVSRATAYRYFPNIETLLLEASLDVAMPEPDELFPDGSSDDPVTRVGKVDAAIQKVIDESEPALRIMLAHTMERRAKGDDTDGLPIRQNRRTKLIEAALAPAQDRFGRDNLEMLKAALALVIGTEGMVVFRDVLQIDDAKASKVRAWSIRALIEAASKDSKSPIKRK